MATTKLDHSEALFERDRATWVEPLLDAVRQLRFGSVEITVHDGRIVQIERKEKLRFETPASPKGDRKGEGTDNDPHQSTGGIEPGSTADRTTGGFRERRRSSK